MWHLLTAHLSNWLEWVVFRLPYFYEFLGGVLIFASSAVTETRLPKTRQKFWHWIVFALLSLLFVGCGIVMRHEELKQNAKNSEQASQDRVDLRSNRDHLDVQMTEVMRSNHETFAQVGSMQSELGILFKRLGGLIVKNDPRQVTALVNQAQALGQQASSFQQELLALTMAPQKDGRRFTQSGSRIWRMRIRIIGKS